MTQEPEPERVIELREEQLVANKHLHNAGEVVVRTEIESVPAQVEVEALREEVEVVHEPVGRTVSIREDPRDESGELIVPVYEEQLVVTKRLVLRERLHIRRISTSERKVVQDTVQRERLVVEDPQHTQLVHELHADDQDARSAGSEDDSQSDVPLLTRIVSKALE